MPSIHQRLARLVRAVNLLRDNRQLASELRIVRVALEELMDIVHDLIERNYNSKGDE